MYARLAKKYTSHPFIRIYSRLIKDLWKSSRHVDCLGSEVQRWLSPRIDLVCYCTRGFFLFPFLFCLGYGCLKLLFCFCPDSLLPVTTLGELQSSVYKSCHIPALYNGGVQIIGTHDSLSYINIVDPSFLAHCCCIWTGRGIILYSWRNGR